MSPTITEPRRVMPALTTLNQTDIDQLAWQPVPRCPGVYVKQLWQSARAVCALIMYEPGARTPGVPHRHAHQHIWVVAGEATVARRRLGAGSFVEIPAGAAHPITDAGPLGCLLLQVHIVQ